MARIYRFVFNKHEQDDADRQTMGLASIAISLLLIVASLVIIKHLQASTKTEDCLMQGRTNCNVIVATAR